MKVWSRTLGPLDLIAAAEQVNAEFPGASVYLGPIGRDNVYEGPRTRRIDGVHLRTANGTHFPNSGTSGAETSGGMAASWTEWGWFIARVFERDPNARCGQYKTMQDFHEQTNGLFVDPRSPRERQIKRELRRADQ